MPVNKLALFRQVKNLAEDHLVTEVSANRFRLANGEEYTVWTDAEAVEAGYHGGPYSPGGVNTAEGGGGLATSDAEFKVYRIF